METKTFNCIFQGTTEIKFQYIVISNYPSIMEVKSNLAYLLKKRDGEITEKEFISEGFQGKSNNKLYKEYEDKKGKYIKYNTGYRVKPKYLKIYSEEII